ncbi:efflux RND transporter permease subunit [Vibrio sp. B1FLJ16]|uniref:efflux RND transporter permease subunit n=1 Tax=Vibrio sp. B1FLJ16 TaxID=2751178 RepID=UPI0015F6DF12|nr:efflux RND transporter permease subunit [Vibrio sp. B1FLJ16]CAD7817910.1 Belongs to the resistance-nodulation-cell division (RND) (TC 2.A.6) family [Vibrio sp. B1FLJ16]CAD7824318.1 Belongs to the resistance-nodulation-cell division (RND) (TC 2.A.6) family [Vibrio sp. B1FLJ16]CAE6932695.1 Belongs to the resistance-nodulation-cell division (RND) (TC 2.A.6) family [Vibrio sp. B1FLJ16]CAE6954258.1 Belongs to the resistance-nodulation-cell division (RND) (TC 2.A.6) family [Vibrio sp. B1FLJ16]
MEDTNQKGLIAYFANNPVAANLLMVFIIIMGIVSYLFIQRQMFPNVEVNYIDVRATYPGASPQEIEESILVKVEESIKDVTGLKKVVSRASRGSAYVSIEVDVNADIKRVLDDVNQRIDTLSNLPAGMEPINVYQVEWRQDVIEMGLVGDRPLEELKPIAKQIEDELLQLKNVMLVYLSAPEEEIAIEVDPLVLRKYDLTLNDVSDAIRRYSANYSAGEVKTNSGMIAVRIENQYYHGDEFRNIPVKLGANGAKVLLQDIATIKDGFTEQERYFEYSGQNAIYMSVEATRDQNIIPVAESVHKYIEAKNKTLPSDVQLKVLVDMTYYLNGRLDMMLKNLLQGAALVAIMLTIFLRFRLAMWVMIGLPVCFLGAVMLMPALGITVNIVSLFAFIMVLGIVVDDAIVMGESAYSEIEEKGGGVDNVVRGVKRVATPATFGVLTTIAVFAPFLLSSGIDSAFFYGIAGVVILCLIFSLIESKLILPAHLAHTNFKPIKPGGWRDRFNQRFFGFVNGTYRNLVTKCTHWRWTVFAVFCGLLAISAALVNSNYVRVIPNPKVPTDYPAITIEMNDTVSSEQTIEALKTIERVMQEVESQTIEEHGQGMIRDVLSYNRSRTEGRVLVPLVDEDLRPFNTFELARRWREAMPTIPGMKSIKIREQSAGGGDRDEFGYLLFGSNINELNEAGRYLIDRLQQQEGLYDISSSIDSGSKEVLLSLAPVAYDLGLDLTMIAQQVGGSFYGGEAQRIIRDGEEIKVMVRYPQLTREAFSSLRYAVITTPAGKKVMLGDVVQINEQPGVSTIRREGGYQTVYVYGSIDEELIEPEEVVKIIDDSILPDMKTQYPSVKTELGGDIEEQAAQRNEQILFFIAGMIIVYILLAVPLKSYTQPLIVMSVIPFSLTGAIWGHFWLGLDISMMSTFGLIAAAGVVINDSLVMTDYVNQVREKGMGIKQAVVEAGCARFRAITLTSITTFAGVLPIMFETSLQARFVIPMAVALGFAVLYATVLTLVLVPCLYLMLEDIKNIFRAIKRFFARFIGRFRKQSEGTEVCVNASN